MNTLSALYLSPLQPASSAILLFIGQGLRVKDLQKNPDLLLNRIINSLIYLFQHISSVSAVLKAACATRVLEVTSCW